MAWDSGTFTRDGGSTKWKADENAGTGIESERHDTHDQELADGINQCLNKNGENPATANISMGGNKLTNVAAGTTPSDAVRYDQLPITLTAWTPTYSATGAMTFTGVSTTSANYTQVGKLVFFQLDAIETCLLYTSPSPRDGLLSRMPSSA